MHRAKNKTSTLDNCTQKRIYQRTCKIVGVDLFTNTNSRLQRQSVANYDIEILNINWRRVPTSRVPWLQKRKLWVHGLRDKSIPKSQWVRGPPNRSKARRIIQMTRVTRPRGNQAPGRPAPNQGSEMSRIGGSRVQLPRHKWDPRNSNTERLVTIAAALWDLESTRKTHALSILPVTFHPIRSLSR